MTHGLRRAIALAATLALSLAACSSSGTTLDVTGKIAEPVSLAAARLESSQPLDDHLARADAEGRLEIYVYLTGGSEDPTSVLASNGLEGIVFKKTLGLAQGWARPTDLKRLAALPIVKRITLPQYAIPR
jgi:hypothetical protein